MERNQRDARFEKKNGKKNYRMTQSSEKSKGTHTHIQTVNEREQTKKEEKKMK